MLEFIKSDNANYISHLQFRLKAVCMMPEHNYQDINMCIGKEISALTLTQIKGTSKLNSTS
jgi:hypothetical protein